MKITGATGLPASMLFSAQHERDVLAAHFAQLLITAAAIAVDILFRGEVVPRVKADHSPVTEADEKIETFLIQELTSLLNGVPIIAEEAATRGEKPLHKEMFLLVDPIDGTREFLAGSPEFTLNIALVSHHAPIVGAIFAPLLQRIWFAGVQAYCADACAGGKLAAQQDWRPLRLKSQATTALRALVSKSHMNDDTRAFLNRQANIDVLPMGSSMKLCLLAEGLADVYPRFGPTMEWDTAAGDAILRAAGGCVLDCAGKPLEYGKAEEFYRNPNFIAWRDPQSRSLATFS